MEELCYISRSSSNTYSTALEFVWPCLPIMGYQHDTTKTRLLAGGVQLIWFVLSIVSGGNIVRWILTEDGTIPAEQIAAWKRTSLTAVSKLKKPFTKTRAGIPDGRTFSGYTTAWIKRDILPHVRLIPNGLDSWSERSVNIRHPWRSAVGMELCRYKVYNKATTERGACWSYIDIPGYLCTKMSRSPWLPVGRPMRFIARGQVIVELNKNGKSFHK